MGSSGRFYSGNVGNGSDAVFVLSFCRGDSANDTCIKCISATAEDLMIECPNQKAAYSKGTFNPPCFIRSVRSDMEELDRGAGSEGFDGTLLLKFASGSTVLPNFQTMYALLQCSPDLSQVDCQSCLGERINDYQGCCHGRLGGSIYKPSCIFRWDLYPFLESNPRNPLPSSPPPTAATEIPPSPPPANAQVTSDWFNFTVTSDLKIMNYNFHPDRLHACYVE
ncbi:hypothetical protein NL676_034551 [Syzygium grande]|nr:hypothetical protein NL676_034551 [Syzygium grande]